MKINLIADNKIQFNDLNPGVLCRDCRKIFMRRDFATWTCPQCGLSDPTAHHEALRDYTRLFDTTINNRTARSWLGLDCPTLTFRLLSTFPITKQVGRKAIQYDLSTLRKT